MDVKALNISSLHKSYVKGVKVLEDINLSVNRGDFLALLGPNGAGKSTLISIICSLLPLDRGEITINGHDLVKDSFLAKKEIGLMPQEFNFNNFEPIEEILANQAGFYGLSLKQARLNSIELLKRFTLYDQRLQLPISLSGGMKRRLMLARMLVSDPSIIILDEPTAGVDVEIRLFIWELLTELNEQGKTVILTTHYLEEAEKLCNTLVLINKGKIIYDGSLAKVASLLQVHTYVIRLKSADVDKACKVLDSQADIGVCAGKDLEHIEVVVQAGINLAPIITALDQNEIAVYGIKFLRSPLEDVFLQMTTENSQPNVA